MCCSRKNRFEQIVTMLAISLVSCASLSAALGQTMPSEKSIDPTMTNSLKQAETLHAAGQATPSGKLASKAMTSSLEHVQVLPNRGQERDPLAVELFEMKKKADTQIVVGETAEDRNVARQFSEMRERQLEIAIHNPRRGRIVNGKPAKGFSDPTRFQYQVALVMTGYSNAGDGQFCGGSLIAPLWILTAAHCIRENSQPGDIRVYTGSYQLSRGGQMLPLSKIIRHELYNGDENHPVNDVALLRLASPINTVKPIPLADMAQERASQTATTNAIISGWGDTAFGSGLGSDDLLYANVGLIDGTTCNDPNHYNGAITDVMICAGDGDADACQGDSGGPLVMPDQHNSWYQEGVVSWGAGCAQASKPGVYARVPMFVAWIRQNMQ